MIGDVLASRDPQTIRRLVLLAVAQAELAWLLLLIVNPLVHGEIDPAPLGEDPQTVLDLAAPCRPTASSPRNDESPVLAGLSTDRGAEI